MDHNTRVAIDDLEGEVHRNRVQRDKLIAGLKQELRENQDDIVQTMRRETTINFWMAATALVVAAGHVLLGG